MKTVVAITGASGIIYGIRLLEELPGQKVLVMSRTAQAILPAETGRVPAEAAALADENYDDADLFAPIASGSCRYEALVVAPCSESSVAKFACGLGDTLISRTFMCALKEGRRIILVIRESPKSAVMLENELKLARLGVTILDANPGFYGHPQTADDVVNFTVARCLDLLGVEQHLLRPWSGH